MDALLAHTQQLQQDLQEMLTRCEKLEARVAKLDERRVYLTTVIIELARRSDERVDEVVALLLHYEQNYLESKRKLTPL